jgi:ATP-dependent helicase YprA (DUF1998 family)
MDAWDTPREYGVGVVADKLRSTLQQYIEAQYHIRSENLIEERRRLLDEVSAIYQVPYIEATPAYKIGKPYSDLAIPDVAKRVLIRLSELNLGIYPQPYVHQGEALEAFLGRREDIVVATGTGSGKTESFLMPIIGALGIEANERAQTAALPGCRAILIYPMNALVNDQLGRVRRLIGSEEASKIVSVRRGRPVRFATYTGRTPYPGKRTGVRDRQLLAPLFLEYYLPLMERPEVVQMLMAKGKWPSKDLTAFFNSDVIQSVPYKSGKKAGKEFVRQNWTLRFNSAPDDRELMTRDEIQHTCPDILITNYSMLEYMLMRPIERTIFQRTRQWLNSDERNELILVIDEAHMYTGASGAEVALLIRRLTSRLGISRERLRCILTSASIGNDDDLDVARDFAFNLTGKAKTGAVTITVIKGTEEERPGPRCGTPSENAALAAFDLQSLEEFATDPGSANESIAKFAQAVRWSEPPPSDTVGLKQYLFDQLTGFGPAELLVKTVSGRAVQLKELSETVFPECAESCQQAAIAALLAICSFAQRGSDKRVYLPTRLHLFFRGLPGLYACVDPTCSMKRSGGAESVLGRMYTEPRISCDCSRLGRVYELLTHRDCGSAFIQGYISGYNGTFLWSEPSRSIGDAVVAPLMSVQLLVDGEPHPDEHDFRTAWLDIATGRLSWDRPDDLGGFRIVYASGGHDDLSFSRCPVCLKRWQGTQSKIMDHQTKGEDPFASLVTAQLYSQPATEPESDVHPNGGRKVLLFSDGRQKAARLARDIPRAVEQDVFREAIALAALRLNSLSREAKPDNELYVALLSVLMESNIVLFDGDDRAQLQHDIDSYRVQAYENLAEALYDMAASANPPSRYQRALLGQLCARFYSLNDVTIGYVEPATRQLDRIVKAFEVLPVRTLDREAIRALAIAWIGASLDGFSFNSRIQENLRRLAAGFRKWPWGSNAKFSSTFRSHLITTLGWLESTVVSVESVFADALGQTKDNEGLFLEPARLKLVVDLAKPWFQCVRCTRLGPQAFEECCIYCGAPRLVILDPASSTYLRARKQFWRAPLERLIEGKAKLRNVAVEEHTAQLSHRDKASAYSTTESYELRFQDVLIGKRDVPIDILSCTTTMEVGIDIGALVAVGLRNVPPQRANYQQRAGRAGRRGSSVSTVVTFAQNGPHDSYFFNNPHTIIAGIPKTPDLKIDNPKIARRHINSFLIQTFFNEAIDAGELIPNGDTSSLAKALGRTDEFFHGRGSDRINLETFADWVHRQVLDVDADICNEILGWLPESLKTAPMSRKEWVQAAALSLLEALGTFGGSVPQPRLSLRSGSETDLEDDDADEEDVLDQSLLLQKEQLLDFLFDHNLLPSYAFPTHLSGFLIEELKRSDYGYDVRVKEQPQQSMDKALSEYAPGRLVVINKETYRSGGVVANVKSTEVDRAAPLFADMRRLVFCTACSYVRAQDANGELGLCKICENELRAHDTIEPEVFTPEGARALREDDRDQDITYATMAQFPVPLDENESFVAIGPHCRSTYTTDRPLLIVNKGIKTQDAYSGFFVCERCGAASPDKAGLASHERPYLTPKKGKDTASRCTGVFRNVYIGTVFKSDVLLLRFAVQDPIIQDTRSATKLHIIEDALVTLAQALVLGAARHPELDLDPRELGSGFRVIPSAGGSNRILDVYLYDTSAGGAGYSELAGRYINDIVAGTLELLSECPGNCDRSCQNCLRHFYNQHLQDRLDRKLAASFLRYVMYGQVPAVASVEEQCLKLKGIKRFLDLEHYDCELNVSLDGSTVPLLVKTRHGAVGVGVLPALLDGTLIPDSKWMAGVRGRGGAALELSEYLLQRNLPDAYRLICSPLASAPPVSR